MGRRHIFVRFAGCTLSCRYCDTPGGGGKRDANPRSCRIQRTPSAYEYEQTANPVSAGDLSRFCRRLAVRSVLLPVLSLTGGEPLLQAKFMRAWLPEIRNSFTIYLETCGIHHEEIAGLRDLIDIVSMDMKLPSATGMRPYWEEHRLFLAASLGREVFVKSVVTAGTAMEDVLRAASLISEADASVPFILQPASGNLTPDSEQMLRLQDAALGKLEDVRIIPQVHKIMNLP